MSQGVALLLFITVLFQTRAGCWIFLEISFLELVKIKFKGSESGEEQ